MISILLLPHNSLDLSLTYLFCLCSLTAAHYVLEDIGRASLRSRSLQEQGPVGKGADGVEPQSHQGQERPPETAVLCCSETDPLPLHKGLLPTASGFLLGSFSLTGTKYLTPTFEVGRSLFGSGLRLAPQQNKMAEGHGR